MTTPWAWHVACRLHSLQIELFHDELQTAFVGLAEATTVIEQRVSTRLMSAVTPSPGGTGEIVPSSSSVVKAEQRLVESVEFFEEEWVIHMTVSFVDIGETLALTAYHLGKITIFGVACHMTAAGLIGLWMMFDLVTIDRLVTVAVLIYFAVSHISHPNIPNGVLRRVRKLSWECYRELLSHSLLFKGEADVEFGSTAEYRNVMNGAKHLLNMVQTSREGLKISAENEYSPEMIKKLLSLSLSASVVILRSGDKSAMFASGGDDVGDGLLNTTMIE
jgi:hypothetical protein